MTAAELFDVVKDVTREAWGNLDWYCGEFVRKHTYDVVESDVAEHAFVGSITAWLGTKKDGSKRTVLISGNLVGWPDNDRELASGVWTWYGTGMSIVAALAAACKEAA